MGEYLDREAVCLCNLDDCDVPGHARFGPQDEWLCFRHGMELLERIRVTAHGWDCAVHRGRTCDKACGDLCPDGPHCGCPQHSPGDDE